LIVYFYSDITVGIGISITVVS